MPTTIIITAKTMTPLHIGANDFEGTFRRNARGQWIIPGTSIAGAIRGHLTRIVPAMTYLPADERICYALAPDLHPIPQDLIRYIPEGEIACNCAVCHLMGTVNPQNHPLEGYEFTPQKIEFINGRASRLTIQDVVLVDPAMRIRDGVGIDRFTGTAARQEKSKFDMQTIEAAFEIKMVLDDSATREDKALVALALDELQAGRIRIGGRSNRGLGRVTVQNIEVTEFNIQENPADLMAYLRRDIPLPSASLNHPHRHYHASLPEIEIAGTVNTWVALSFDIQAQGFFLCNDMTNAQFEGFDHYSWLTLPGSSLRGVLRSHAERIARTMTSHMKEDDGKFVCQNEDDFLKRCPASYPLSQSVTEGETLLESGASRWKRSAFKDEIPDVERFDLAEQLWGNTYWGSRLTVEDGLPIDEQREPITDPQRLNWQKIDFVAIDRFTGGAAEGAKFDAYALWQPCFKTRLYLEAPVQWELGWLLMLLRDMQDGLVPMGFGAAKGFGQVKLANIEWQFGYTYPELFPAPFAPDATVTSFFMQAVGTHDSLPPEWQAAWLDAWIEKVQGYKVDADLPHQPHSDPYWRDTGSFSLNELYPRGN